MNVSKAIPIIIIWMNKKRVHHSITSGTPLSNGARQILKKTKRDNVYLLLYLHFKLDEGGLQIEVS